MVDKIDITMTAVLRSKVLRQTLESFCKNVFYNNRDRYRLIVNIDLVGDNEKPKSIIKTCRRYFDNVVFNISKTPSFPKAAMWVWSQVEADWIFHLEDDWIITRKIDIDNMIKILKERSGLACLRLYKEKIPNKKKVKIFNSRYIYNKEGFYVADDRKRQFGLNPVLIRSKYIKQALPLMVETKNPEKQFRYGNTAMRDFVMKWQYAIYGRPGDKRLINDNGLFWRRRSKFKKPDGGKLFLKWESR